MANPTTEPLMQENITKPKTKSSTLSLIKDFTDYTSIHGLGRSGGAKYLVQRIAWVLLFLVAFGVATFQLRELYVKFESRPVSTNIKLTNKATLLFPQVTICNLNPMNATLLKKLDPELYQEITKFKNDDDDDEVDTLPPQADIKKTHNTSTEDDAEEHDFDNQSTRRTRRTLDNNKEPKPAGNENNNNADGNDDNNNEDDRNEGGDSDDYDSYDEDDSAFDPSELLVSHRKREMMHQFISEIDVKIGYQIGHQFQDSVLACSYRGKDCKKKMSKYWDEFWHHKYGLCFNFNGAAKSVKPLKSHKAGPSHGLNLKLFVDQANYMSQFTKTAGFKIVINQQGLMTFPYEEGINVLPGVSSAIGIRQVLIKRADPFNNNSCYDVKRSNKGNLYSENYGTKYSNTACRESCLAYNQRKHCNCTEYRFPFSDKTPGCDLFNATHSKCLRKVNAMFKHNKLNCSKECTPACYEEHFKLSTSYAAWPSKKYEEEMTKGNTDNSHKKILFSDDYLKVEIFYEQLNYEVIEEVVSYELIDFVSDVGGQLGLWLGVSVLAAAEVLELIMLIFFYLCKKEKKEREENQKETTALEDEMELPTITNV